MARGPSRKLTLRPALESEDEDPIRRDFKRWMTEAEILYRRWLAQNVDDDPFAYNETASASILAAAATMTGGLGIADYHTQRRARYGEGASDRWHRCDLWVRHPDRCTWAVELKQASTDGLKTKLSRILLQRRLTAAIADASRLRGSEADHRLGALVVSTWWQDARRAPDKDGLLDSCMDLAPYAARFGEGRSQVLILMVPVT